MTSPKISLQEQRHLLQQQLRAQRQHILLQLDPPFDKSQQYPRSATMRFLSSKTGLILLTKLAVWRFSAHSVGTLSVAQSFIKFFSGKENWKLFFNKGEKNKSQMDRHQGNPL